MWVQKNENPARKIVGDCVVRAISSATGMDWDTTFIGLAVESVTHCDMPSSNAIWGSYLKRLGFNRHFLPDTCPDCYNTRDFCFDHPNGVYILAFSSHVCAVIDGNYYDTWDCGEELPIYYWMKE